MKISELESKISNGSMDINDYLSLGALYFEAGDLRKLLSLYSQALKMPLHPSDEARIHYERAEALELLNRTEEAIGAFKKAIVILEEKADSWEAQYIICNSYYNLFLQCLNDDQREHYFNAAERHFGIAIKSYPDHDDLHYIYSAFADLYMRNNKNDQALYYYQKAIDCNVDEFALIQCLCGVASVYARKFNYEKAMFYFEEALNTARDHSMNPSKIYFDIGEMYYSMEFSPNSLSKSEEAFKNALKHRKSNLHLRNDTEFELQIHWYLGRIAYEGGIKTEETYHHFRKTLDLIVDRNHPFYSSSHLILGNLHLESGDRNMAKEHYNEVLLSPNAEDEQIKIAKQFLSQINET